MLAVLCTTNSIDSAKAIAEDIVKSNLAACVNIIPKILSVYKWKGNIESDEEFLLIIKTKNTLYKELEQKIKNLHPYEIPELIAFEIKEGSKEYLNWINESI